MRSFLSAASLLLLACTHQEPTAGRRLVFGKPAVDQEFQLAIGETANVSGTDLSVTAQAVVRDSRCPRDVRCISAGSATIELLARQPSRDSVLVLSLGDGWSSELAILPGFTIEFTTLSPYPAHAAVPIPIEDYRVGLVISALPSLPGAPLPLTRVAASGFGGFDSTATLVVRDSAAWSDLWQHLWGLVNEVPPLPAVDFATEMIVAFASGTKPTLGHDVILTGAAEDGGVVLVQALVRAPASDCFTGQAITHPIDVARMPTRADPVRFTATRGVVHCGT